MVTTEENRAAHKEYGRRLSAENAAMEKQIEAKITYEESALEEKAKYKDLLKADPIAVEIMIRKNTEKKFKAYLAAEKALRAAQLSVKRAGAKLSCIEHETEIEKLALGKV